MSDRSDAETNTGQSEARRRVSDWGVSKLEARWVAFLTSIALMFGGWWLQNQYATVLRIQDQIAEIMRHVDDGYVRKEYLQTVIDRVRRIEDKIDKLEDQQRDDARRDAVNHGAQIDGGK